MKVRQASRIVSVDVVVAVGVNSDGRREVLGMSIGSSEAEIFWGKIKRRTDVVGIFSNEDAITRLVGAILLEKNDEWAVQRARYVTLASIAQSSNDPLIALPTMAA